MDGQTDKQADAQMVRSDNSYFMGPSLVWGSNTSKIFETVKKNNVSKK